jgi:hypothetical protein
MKAFRGSLRKAPRTVVAFSALHVLIGLFFLWALISMHCVDEPVPPGEYRFDGCSLSYDPWLEGHAPQLLVPIVLLIASSLWLLRGSKVARLMLLVAIVTVVYAYYLSAISAAVARGAAPDAHPSWVVSWADALRAVTPVMWLFPIFWAAVASWFLFSSGARAFFSAPPSNSLERTREG